MTHKIPAILLLASAALLPAQGLPPLIDRELLFGNPEIAGGQISPDGKYLAFLKPWNGKYVAYVKDNEGDENYNLYAVDPSATPAAGAQAPPSRDLTGLKGVRVMQYSAPKNDPDTVYIGIND